MHFIYKWRKKVPNLFFNQPSHQRRQLLRGICEDLLTVGHIVAIGSKLWIRLHALVLRVANRGGGEQSVVLVVAPELRA